MSYFYGPVSSSLLHAGLDKLCIESRTLRFALPEDCILLDNRDQILTRPKTVHGPLQAFNTLYMQHDQIKPGEIISLGSVLAVILKLIN